MGWVLADSVVVMAISALPEAGCASSNDALSGRVFDIKRFSTHDGPGIRSTVFLTRCPLRCAWCHNPEAFVLDQTGAEDGFNLREMSVPELVREVEKDIAYYDRSGGGVTVSGGEPLVQMSFVESFLSMCQKRDLHTAVDTSGCVSVSAIEMAAEKSDLILYDLKSVNDKIHTEWTGVSNKLILDNLRRLNELEVDVWIRMPLIPGVNDDEGTLDETIQFLQGTRFRRVSLLPYHQIGAGKYERLGLENRMRGVEPQTPEEIEAVRHQFAAAGFNPHIGT